MNVPSKTLLMALVKKLKANQNLFTARLTLQSINQLIRRKHCVILSDREIVYGFAALWATKKKGYYEVGPIWIDESYRGKGFAGQLFKEVLKLIPQRGTHVFLITKSEIIASLAHSHDWASVDNWQTSFWRGVYEPLDGSTRVPHEQAKLFYRAL